MVQEGLTILVQKQSFFSRGPDTSVADPVQFFVYAFYSWGSGILNLASLFLCINRCPQKLSSASGAGCTEQQKC